MTEPQDARGHRRNATVGGHPVSDRTFRGWFLYFGGGTIVICVVFLANLAGHTLIDLVPVALTICIGPFYWLTARPSVAGIRSNSVRAWTYCLFALLVFLFLLCWDSWAQLMLFILSPQVFLLLSIRPASIMIVVLNTGALLIGLTRTQMATGQVWQSLALTIGVIVLSIVFSYRLTSASDENAQHRALIAKLEERQHEIAELSKQQGVSNERERIAREMHDTLAQGFTSIIALGHVVADELDSEPVAAKQHIEMMMRTARENLNESRRIIAELMPGHLNESSLIEAIERIGDSVKEETGIDVSVMMTGSPRSGPANLEVAILRVCQESLSNVRKHAHARSVDINLGYASETVTLTVHDDGIGFSPETLSMGYGMQSMRSRLDNLGGQMQVESSAFGTTITACFPFTTSSNANTVGNGG